MAKTAKKQLGLDELQGRLLRLQDSPAFPDLEKQNALNDSIREKERIEDELEELQAVKSTLFRAPHPAKIQNELPRKDLFDEQQHRKVAEPLSNGDGPIPGLAEPDSPVVVMQGSIAARKEIDIMQQQLKVTCLEIISLKKAAAKKEEEGKRTAEQHRAEVAALNDRVKAAETEMENMRTANSYETLLRVEALEDELKNANKAIDILENVRKELEADKQELEEYNRNIKGRKSDLDEAHQEATQEIERLKNVVIEQSQEKLILQKAQEQKEEEITSLSQTVDTLKETVRASVEELKTTLANVEELQAVERRMQTEIVELTANNEELRAKDEIAQQSIVELAEKNAKMNRQNLKLSVELPQRMQAQVDELQKDAVEAKRTRAKQVRRLERRIEKRDEEIARLRRVWRALLTSHPDINEAAEAAVDEVRELNALVLRLEGQVAELQEQNEGLTINVAITYIRLMLANWRRPMYLRMLQQRVAEAGDDETRLEALEMADAGIGEEEAVAEEEQQMPLAPRALMEPPVMEDGLHGEGGGEGEVVSPPMSAFSLGVATVPAASTNRSMRDLNALHADEGAAGEEAGASPNLLTPRSGGSHDTPRIDPVRFKALQEGRAKYSNSFSGAFHTDGHGHGTEGVAGEEEGAAQHTREELFGAAEAEGSGEGQAGEQQVAEDSEDGAAQRRAAETEADEGGEMAEASEGAGGGAGGEDVLAWAKLYVEGAGPGELVVEGEGDGEEGEEAAAERSGGGVAAVPVVLPIIGTYQASPPSPRVSIDWAPVEAKIPSLPPSRSASHSPPQGTGAGAGDEERPGKAAVEQLEKLRANASEVREWAMAEMARRQHPEPGPLAAPTQARPPQNPALATPSAQGSGFHPAGIKYTPTPPDIGMLEELTAATPSRSRTHTPPRIRLTPAPAHGWPLPSSAARAPPQPASSSKPLHAPPRDPPAGGGGGGGGWPGVSPDADLSKWVLGWLTPSSPSPRDPKPRQHGLSRNNLYPQELYARSPAEVPPPAPPHPAQDNEHGPLPAFGREYEF